MVSNYIIYALFFKVWGFVIANNESRLSTGCGDSELRVWKISYPANTQDAPASELGAKRSAIDADLENESDVLQSDKQESQPVTCELLGSVIRQSRARVTSLHSSNSGQILGCLGNDSQLELFRITTEEEINKSLQKRMKRARKKQRKEATDPEKAKFEDISITRTVEDEFVRVFTLRVSAKTKAFDLHQNFTAEDVKVLLLLQNNTIEVHNIPVSGQIPQSSLVEHVRQPGHRSDVRTISLSSDGMCVLSGSQETLKVWNRDSQQCIHTMSTGYTLCSFFVPGDKHAIIGTKEGKIEIYDIAAGSLLESVEAHEGPVWSLSLAPDKRGFVSGSGDSTVKFWEFELITDENYSKTSKRLGIAHVQTLKLKEEVVCVKYSPNQKLLAVSLLDCTVKVFFADSLKFFLSLYGHKLPVMALDISSDSTLIITGSADKNIKIWGLDFGDCHKSIFAHDDGIMGLQFIANTHYFMSVSKDKTLKYWDADKFEQIMVLQGHQGEVWCLAVSPNGEYVVTGSHDKSLRLWQRTDEPLIIDEEREQERETAFEETLAQGPEQVIPGENDSEARKAGKKTMESMKSAEQLMEAIELHREESAKMFEYRTALKVNKKAPLPPTNPILMAFGNISSSRYVLQVTQKIRSSELEEALVVLPFDYVIDILKLLDEWIKANWEIELSCRCLFFLMRIHHNQIAATSKLLPVIDSIRQNTKRQVHGLRDIIGFNQAGMQFLRQEMEAKEISFFTDATEKLRNIRKKRKTVKQVVI
uniref:WD repeat-containing protein 3-like n=1 Tax=Actinia tenebrosa TaxID=6105 RepID=A0A6P8IV86_ACTTE